MMSPFHNIYTSFRREHQATDLRNSMHDGFNRALTTTTGFFRGLISDSDAVHAGSMVSRTRGPSPQPHLVQYPVVQPMGVDFVAARTQTEVKRGVEVFGLKRPYKDAENSNNSCFPDLHDLRMSLPRKRSISNRPELDSQGSRKRERTKLVRNSREVTRMNFVLASAATNTDSITDWRKRDNQRRRWAPVCRERRRVIACKSLMKEPDKKVQRIVPFWIVRKQDNEIMTDQTFDSCQYDLERSLSPPVCVTRKILETSTEESERKIRRMV